MDSALILISNAVERTVTEAAVRSAAAALPSPTRLRWLAPRVACEIHFAADPDNTTDLTGAVAAALDGAALDHAILPASGRRKSLLVADMDSTVIEQECIDELGALTGLGSRIAAITERAMQGKVGFEAALRERVALLKDLDAGSIDRVIAERITFTPGARTLVATMRAAGAHTVLVSGGFSAFTAHVAETTGFDAHQGNRLMVEDGKLCGTVAEPILGRNAKVEALMEICQSRGLSAEDSLAVGDGANDLDMLAAAGIGVAFHAKPVVAKSAGVRIDHGDLTALLFLQGYAADEFID